jgi:hypothetical protein
MTHDVGLPPSIDALRKDYSITSSARARTVGGTVMPSALAVAVSIDPIAASHMSGATMRRRINFPCIFPCKQGISTRDRFESHCGFSQPVRSLWRFSVH